MNPELLVVLVACPFVGAVLLFLARGKSQDILAFVLPAGYLILGLVVVFGGMADFPLQSHLMQLPWLGSDGSLPLRLDALGTVLLLVVLIIGMAVMAFSIFYMGPGNREHPIHNHEGNGRYYFFLSLFIGSMVGVALAGNLLVLFIFWEITTFCSYALISHRIYQAASVRAGFKALVMTHVGGVFFFCAIAIVYSMTGSFAFEALRRLDPDIQAVVFVFLLIAATAKSAQVPLFTWLPDAMEAPTPISAYLHAAAMVKAGVYLMARVIYETGTLPTWTGGLMAGLALVTMIVALIFYFYQDDLKRFLAFSTIAQLSYIMLGLSLLMLGSKTGFRAGVFHIACHAPAKALLFLCVGVMAMRLGVKSISKISGLYRKMPVVSICFFVGLLAVTGIPPFSCFWSKLLLVIGILELKGMALTLIAVPFVLEIVLTFFWFLRVGQKVLFGEPSESVNAAQREPGALVVDGILIAVAALTLLMPAIVYPFLKSL
jgi:hydrogenase-4 component D